uniref:Uncharacterized protein n=1 Tax=Panagrolaimus superbus TaxID=310955 RepID=A0A914Z316_9BILA
MSSGGPYTPVLRKSRCKPLTPEQVKHILENPYPTGYTYANSSSYSINNPREYINPNLSRSSLLSSSCSSSYDFDEEDSSSSYIAKPFWFIISLAAVMFQGFGDFFNTNGYMMMQLKKILEHFFRDMMGKINGRPGLSFVDFYLFFWFLENISTTRCSSSSLV